MTGNAVRGQTRELTRYMTALTCCCCMRARQGKSAEIVIECCWGPTICAMTLTAVQTEASLMRLVCVMTGIAVLQCNGKVAQPARVDMALNAGQTHVLSGQLERENTVIEMVTEAIHAVMAIEAGSAKGQHMRSHKRRIGLTVTTVTGFRCECGYIVMMTIIALERLSRRRLPVAV